MINEWAGTFDDWREEIEEIRDRGTQVYVLAVQHGRGKGSGIEVEERYALIYEVKGDKIARMTMYGEPAEALEDASASVRPASSRPASRSRRGSGRRAHGRDGSSRSISSRVSAPRASGSTPIRTASSSVR